MISNSSPEKLSPWERVKQAIFESSEKESSKPFKERLKGEAEIPFHLYKGAVQGGLKLLESGSGFNGIKTSFQDLHQITTDRTQFEQNKKQQKEAFIEFGKETVQYGKELSQDYRKKLHELWDGVTNTASQKAVDFIKLPRKEQAEIVGTFAPDVAFSALGIEEAAALTQGEKIAAALVKENNILKGKSAYDWSFETANKIGSGHAFQKHVMREKEFFNLENEEKFIQHIEKILRKPDEVKQLLRERTAYWDNKTKTIVIVDPHHVDKGTAFIPETGKKYFDSLKSRGNQ